MHMDEYKECMMQSPTGFCARVWLPPNASRVCAAIDLNEDGKLWTVVWVHHEKGTLTRAQVETMKKYDPTVRWVEGWKDSGKRINPKTGEEIEWRPPADSVLVSNGSVCTG